MGRRERRMQERQQALERGAASLRDDQRQFMPEEYFREKVAKMDRLQRNGITVADLKENYDKGWHDGFYESGDMVIRSCYAAICLALNDLYGFGQKRCMAVLNVMDQHLTMTLTSQEAIDEVYNRMGLQIEFQEAFDRVREVEKQ